MKKIVSLIIPVILLALIILPTCADNTVEFGSYPQSEVTDSSLISELNSSEGEWISYGYYSGNGSLGSAKSSDYMQYKDVELGNAKYRGVKFTSYRPMKTHETSSSKTYQSKNGYKTNTVYWFKYEPLKWKVLDSKTGLLMCKSIIDSQPFNNYVVSKGDAYYNETGYAHDYGCSSLRSWLNEDFYNTAFTQEEMDKIKMSNLSMTYYPSSKPKGTTSVSDKVFVLSREEATNSSYGFKSSIYASDSARRAKGTAYAECQGLHVCEIGFGHLGNSCWWFRSPGYYSRRVNKAFYDGYCAIDSYYYVELTDIGVRPCIRIEM